MSEINAGNLKGGIELDTDKLSGGIRRAVAEATSGAAKLTEALGRPFAPAAAEVGKLDTRLRDVNGRFSAVADSGREVNSVLSQIAGTAIGTALGGLASSAAGAFRSLAGTLQDTLHRSLTLSAAFESTSLAMKTMVGDAGLAKGLLDNLKGFATSTPFQFPELATAAKQLLAMGVNADAVVPSLRMIGDVSSGLNVPIGEMAYLFGQIKSQGRAMTEDLNQFAGRGVPIYSELAKLLNTNIVAIREMASEGRIGFAEIEAAFRSMTSEGGRFNGMTAQLAETTQGLMSTLGDSIEDVYKQIGDALIAGGDGKKLLKEITAEIDKMKPAVVDLAVSLAAAFGKLLPYLKDTLEYLRAEASELGLLDLHKLNKNPYDATSGRDPLKGVTNAPQSDDALSTVQSGVKNSATAAAAELAKSGDSTYSNSFKVQETAKEVIKQSEAAEKLLAAMKAARANGESVSDEQFNAAKSAVEDNLKLLGKLQESLGKAREFYDTFEWGKKLIPNVDAALRKIRESQRDANKSIRELEKDAEVAGWMNADPYALGQTNAAPSPAASPAAPPSLAGATSAVTPSTPGGPRTRNPRTLSMPSGGKDENADLLQAVRDRDAAIRAITQSEEAGGTSFSDAINGRRGAVEKYEADVKAIRERFAKERATKAEQDARRQGELQERIDTHRVNLQATILEAAGKAAEAQLLKFDAEWQRRIRRIKDDGERTVAQAEYEALRRAKIGAGSSAATSSASDPNSSAADKPSWLYGWQQARGGLTDQPRGAGGGGDLSQQIGKMSDLIYRPGKGGGRPDDLLFRPNSLPSGQLRFNLPNLPSPLDGVNSLQMPRLPSALDGVDAMLRRPGASGQQQPAAPAQVNVVPQINISEERLAAACVRAIEPIINRKIDNIRRSLDDEAYSREIHRGI